MDSKNPLKLNKDELRSVAEKKLASKLNEEASASAPEELLHELQVHQIELEMQNEALKQAHMALEESRDRYQDLYDFAPLGYLTLSADGIILEINLTGAKLLGVERKHLLQKRFTSFVTYDDQDKWTRLFMSVKKNDAPENIELAIRSGDGSIFHVQLECLRHKTSTGAVAIRMAMTDVTERKLAVDELREMVLTNMKLSEEIERKILPK